MITWTSDVGRPSACAAFGLEGTCSLQLHLAALILKSHCIKHSLFHAVLLVDTSPERLPRPNATIAISSPQSGPTSSFVAVNRVRRPST